MTRSYREHAAPADLADLVACFWTSSSDGPGPDHAVWPDGALDLLYDVGAGRLDVVGAMRRTRRVPNSGPNAFVAVRFRPGGARPFLSAAAHELTDARVPARALLGDRAARLEDALGAAQTPEAGVGALAEALRARRPSEALDPALRRAAATLWGSSTPVADVAAAVGVSRQHLRRRFLEAVGVSPKVFARLGRVARARAALEATDAPAATIALDAGFADQAHLARELRAIGDTTASALRGRARVA